MNVLNQNVLDNLIFYLKKAKYPGKLQELKLEYCTDGKKHYIYLISIQIKKSQRNQGYGSKILQEIVQFADSHNVRIVLYATNIFGAELTRLYRFYEKHGFVLIKKDNDGKFVYRPKKRLHIS